MTMATLSLRFNSTLDRRQIYPKAQVHRFWWDRTCRADKSLCSMGRSVCSDEFRHCLHNLYSHIQMVHKQLVNRFQLQPRPCRNGTRPHIYTNTSTRIIKADSHLSCSRWQMLLLWKFGDLLYSSQKHLLYYTFLSVGHSLTIVTGVYFGTDGVLHRECSFLSFSLSMRCSLSPRLTFSEQLNHSRVAPPRLSQLV